MIKRKQINHDYTDFGLDLTNPDFVALANSFGAKGYRIDKPDDFKSEFAKIITES